MYKKIILRLSVLLMVLGISLSNCSQSEGTKEFRWPAKKFPCDIPFKVLNMGNRMLAWEIQSITCTGQAKDKSGYLFVLRGKGVRNTNNSTLGSRSIKFVPEEKNSTKINMSQAAVYMFPAKGVDESFEINFKGLFPGYYNEKLFVGFLIINE